MAAIARRTWATLKTEFIAACHGYQYSDWSDRAEELITGAYLDICSLYHHREFESRDAQILSSAGQMRDAVLEMPSDCWILVGIAQYQYGSTNSWINWLKRVNISTLMGTINSNVTGTPEQYAVFEEQIYLNTSLAVAGQFMLHYIKEPTAPDFDGSDSPEIDRVWDEHILELALARAGIRTGDPDLAKVNADLYRDWVSQQPQPLLKDSTAPDKPSTPTADRVIAGNKT